MLPGSRPGRIEQSDRCKKGTVVETVRLATCLNPSDGIAAADALVLTLVGGPDERAWRKLANR